MKGRVRLAAVILAALVVAACTDAQTAGGAPAMTTHTLTDTSTPIVAPAAGSPSANTTPAPTAKPPPHVFVIVMENTGFARALRAPSIASLASQYALATSYRAVSRPSLPNYLAMTSGSTWDITDDGYHALPSTGIGAQLTAAGVSWRAYMEGMTSAGCMRSPYPYALKHNPFAYYGGCPENVVPLDGLEADLASDAPRFVWITPGLCHDAHDCPIFEAGAWLSGLVGTITSSAAWDERSVLFVAWDEGDGGDGNVVPLIVASPRMAGHQITGAYDHYSLLATVEDLYSLPRLGAAANATSLMGALGGRD